MNQLTVTGNVTEKPELRSVAGDKTVSNFSVAVNGLGENAKTTYFPISAWAGFAKAAERMEKGSTGIFTCRTKIRKYTDKDGNKRQSLEATVEQLDYVAKGTYMASKQEANYLGRLTGDPIQEGKRVRFSIAVNDRYNKENVSYFECISFEKQAEFAMANLKSGMQVQVKGRFDIDRYETKDGKQGDSIRLLLAKDGLSVSWPKGNKEGVAAKPTPAGIAVDDEIPF